MLWTGTSAAVSEPFRDLLLELAQERSLAVAAPHHTEAGRARGHGAGPPVAARSRGSMRGLPQRPQLRDRSAACTWWPAPDGRPAGPRWARRDRQRLPPHPAGGIQGGPGGAHPAARGAGRSRARPATSATRLDRAQRVQGFVGQPLLCRGEMLGVLGVFLRSPATPAAVDVLSFLANHAAAAIASARAFAEVEAMRRQLQLENHYLRQSVDPACCRRCWATARRFYRCSARSRRSPPPTPPC